MADWLPVLCSLGAYFLLKPFGAAQVNLTRQDALLARADKAIFGCLLPEWVGYPAGKFSYLVAGFCYTVAYPVVVAGLLLYVHAVQHDQFSRIASGVAQCALIAYLCYLCVPAQGPLRQDAGTLGKFVQAMRYDLDCFPSLHTALPAVTVALAWSYVPVAVSVIAGMATVGVIYAALSLHYHYGVDILGGIILAAVVAVVNSC